jgi:hypothetical protein
MEVAVHLWPVDWWGLLVGSAQAPVAKRWNESEPAASSIAGVNLNCFPGSLTNANSTSAARPFSHVLGYVAANGERRPLNRMLRP